jgi:DNA primase
MEGIEFPEALRILAKKAGVELKRVDPKLRDKKNRLYEISQQAKDYFKRTLHSPIGEKALEYLKKRGFFDKTINEFELGFAPDSFDVLSIFLKKKGYQDIEIYNAGLSVKKEKGGYYNRFRGRIIFPIFNVHGDVVGFGGRILATEGTEKIAKYINTPQTLIYDKSRVIYGLHKAKGDIRKKDQVIVVEGYMDVLASHQAGVENVVSSSGTALTEEQIDLLSRYTKNINLAFDIDLAGDSATKRGIELALVKGANVKIVNIPFGSDPDECIKKDVRLWEKAILKSLYFIDFYFKNVFSKIKDKKVSLEDKKKISQELLPVIKKIPDKIEQAHYVQKLAAKLDIEEKVVYDALRNIQTKEGVYTVGDLKPTEKKPIDQMRVLQEHLLGLVLTFPEYIKHLVTNLEASYFTFLDLQEIYKNLQVFYTKYDEFDLKKFKKELDPALCYKVDMITLKVEHFYQQTPPQALLEEINSYILRLKKIKLEKEKKNLHKEIKKAEEQRDKEKVTELVKKFQKITKEVK